MESKSNEASNDSSTVSPNTIVPNMRSSQYAQVFPGGQPSASLVEAAQFLSFPANPILRQQPAVALLPGSRPTEPTSTNSDGRILQVPATIRQTSAVPNLQQQQQQQSTSAQLEETSQYPLSQDEQQQQQEQQPFFPPAPPRYRRRLGERERFFLFCKVLFKYLERTNNPRLRQKAKAVVSECTRRNRMGDSNYSPLKEAVEHRLRGVVGDVFWTRVESYCEAICEQKGLLTTSTAVSAV